MILNVTGRVPPSDSVSHWRFPVAPGVMLRAKGHEELYELIFQYRLNNNIDPGDPARDVSTWYCDQFPKFCSEEPSDKDPTIPHVSSEPILNRVTRWVSGLVHRMPRGGYPLVASAEAERRAGICAACPKQEAAWRGGCSGCSSAVLQLLQAVKSLKKTSRDGSLSACKVMGFETGCAVWLPLEALPVTPDQRAALPEACWRKNAT